MVYTDKDKEAYERAYYQAHKDEIDERQRKSERKKEYMKAYNKENKERQDAYRNVKFECPCGGKYTKRHQAAHKNSQKHIKWLDKLIESSDSDSSEYKCLNGFGILPS